MTEVEKIRSSQLADMSAPELQVRLLNEPKDVKMLRKKFSSLIADIQSISLYDKNFLEKKYGKYLQVSKKAVPLHRF